MKRNYLVLFIMVFALFFTASSVQAAETLKIGIVDLQRVIAESKTVDSYRKKLEKDVESKNSLLSVKQNAALQIEEKLQKDGSRLQADERKSLEEKLRREMKELKRMREDMELEMKKADRELTERSLKGINAVVEQIYEKENYSIIFEKSAAGVVKFRNPMDITDKVIKAYDTK
jgi:outer membrane protein